MAGLDQRGGRRAFAQVQLFDGVVGDHGIHHRAAGQGERHFAVHRAARQRADHARELVARRKAHAFAASQQHHQRRFDIGHGADAHRQPQRLNAVGGDHGHQHIAADGGQLDFGVDGAADHGGEGSGKDIAGADLHDGAPGLTLTGWQS